MSDTRRATLSRRYTRTERAIHQSYAAKCCRAEEFSVLSTNFIKMKVECELLTLRSCSSREFRDLVRLARLNAVATKPWPMAGVPTLSKHDRSAASSHFTLSTNAWTSAFRVAD